MPPAPGVKRRKTAHPCNGTVRYRALSFPAGNASAIGLHPEPSVTPVQHHLLDLSDRFGGIEVFGAGFRAVHDGVAAVQPKRIFETVQTLARRFIARVDDPTIGGQQRGRSQIALTIPPIARTAGGAASTKEACRGPIHLFLILLGLEPFTV